MVGLQLFNDLFVCQQMVVDFFQIFDFGDFFVELFDFGLQVGVVFVLVVNVQVYLLGLDQYVKQGGYGGCIQLYEEFVFLLFVVFCVLWEEVDMCYQLKFLSVRLMVIISVGVFWVSVWVCMCEESDMWVNGLVIMQGMLSCFFSIGVRFLMEVQLLVRMI